MCVCKNCEEDLKALQEWHVRILKRAVTELIREHRGSVEIPKESIANLMRIVLTNALEDLSCDLEKDAILPQQGKDVVDKAAVLH
jgi:hypothetical protein